jgi:hypothetical protein
MTRPHPAADPSHSSLARGGHAAVASRIKRKDLRATRARFFDRRGPDGPRGLQHGQQIPGRLEADQGQPRVGTHVGVIAYDEAIGCAGKSPVPPGTDIYIDGASYFSFAVATGQAVNSGVGLGYATQWNAFTIPPGTGDLRISSSLVGSNPSVFRTLVERKKADGELEARHHGQPALTDHTHPGDWRLVQAEREHSKAGALIRGLTADLWPLAFDRAVPW